jgi:hypothetical protein
VPVLGPDYRPGLFFWLGLTATHTRSEYPLWPHRPRAACRASWRLLATGLASHAYSARIGVTYCEQPAYFRFALFEPVVRPNSLMERKQRNWADRKMKVPASTQDRIFDCWEAVLFGASGKRDYLAHAS